MANKSSEVVQTIQSDIDKLLTEEVSVTDLQWRYMGRGNFNYVFVDPSKRYVLKQMSQYNETDLPDRAVKVWNVINDTLQIKAHKVNDISWICPYIQGGTPSDHDIAKSLISIYNRTHYIVVDACAEGNFIRTPSGKTFCVDVGMALLFSDLPTVPITLKKPDLASISIWEEIGENINAHFQYDHKTHPLSTEIIQSLLYITRHYPGIVNADFLLDSNNCFFRESITDLYQNKSGITAKKKKAIKGKLYQMETIQLANPFNQPSFDFSFLHSPTFFSVKDSLEPNELQLSTAQKTQNDSGFNF